MIGSSKYASKNTYAIKCVFIYFTYYSLFMNLKCNRKHLISLLYKI